MQAAATGDGLALLTLPGTPAEINRRLLDRYYPERVEKTGHPILTETHRQVCAFLEGRLRVFELALDIGGTAFQKLVLAEVARIPYGRTRTYGEIARAVGNPGAVRAVGMANARNRLPIVIPCHRVVAENGLGGYAGGLAMKRRLLALEGARRYEKSPDLFDYDNHKGDE